MAQETINQKIVKRVRGEIDSAPSRELILAKIASNRAVWESLEKFKILKKTIDIVGTPPDAGTDAQETLKAIRQPKNTKQYKIRILGQHDDSVPSDDLPWAWPNFTHGPNPMWDTGSPFYPVGTWVYVYKDPISNQYFIDRVSANSVCEIKPGENGWQPGDGEFLLVPDTMYRKQHSTEDGVIPARIPPCASVSDYQVYAAIDDKQFNIKDNSITFSTYCRSRGSTDTGSQISGTIKQGKKISERLDEQFKFLENFKTGIDDAIEDWEGYKDDVVGIGADTRSFWQSLRTNDITEVAV